MADPLIPRADLFGNPSEAGTQISPDGRWLSWLAPVDGVLNVWVAPVDDRASALPVTQDTSRGIRIHCWTYLTDRLLYVHDIAGDENFHVFAVDVVDRTTKDLTPMKGVAARSPGGAAMYRGRSGSFWRSDPRRMAARQSSSRGMMPGGRGFGSAPRMLGRPGRRPSIVKETLSIAATAGAGT